MADCYGPGVSALLSLVLLLGAPSPSDDATPGEAAPIEAAPTEAAPAEPGSDDAKPSEHEPPPPTLDGPQPEVPEAPKQLPPGLEPAPETSTANASIASQPRLPPEPDEDELVRELADMPLGATAARKSADRRNNDVLVRSFRRPVYSVAASARFATLLSGGADVIQPFGYGFAAQLRIHALGLGKSRFGAELHAGHTRWPERNEYETIEGAEPITRASLLTATDFSAGPSMHIPMGPLFVEFGGSAGVALSTLFRPLSADDVDDELISVSNFMLRGGLSLGIPLLNRHGLSLGAGVHHIFSPRTVEIDRQIPDGDTTQPFGTWLEVLLGYQIWF